MPTPNSSSQCPPGFEADATHMPWISLLDHIRRNFLPGFFQDIFSSLSLSRHTPRQLSRCPLPLESLPTTHISLFGHLATFRK